MNPVRQAAMLDMCYNLGITKFLEFKNMLRYLEMGKYTQAGVECRNSAWFSQVGARGERISKMIETGFDKTD